MNKKSGEGSIVLFENDSVRRVWVEQEERWYFSVVDVCGVLTESERPKKYWNDLKKKLKDESVNETVTKCNGLKKVINEDNQLVTNCHQLKDEGGFQQSDFSGRLKDKEDFQLSTICRELKLLASDGKMRATDCADMEGLLRVIQSIPSPKAEPFKRWLTKVGYRL